MNLSKTQKLVLAISGVVIVAGAATYFIVKHYRKTNSISGDFEPILSEEEEEASSNNDGSSNELDTKVQKGTKNNSAKEVQKIINQIAEWRGWKDSEKKIGLSKVTFPISVDGDFGKGSDNAAKLIFSSYADTGSITLNKANEKLAYSAGYYKKTFPQSLLDKYKTSEVLRNYDAQYRKGLARK